MLVLNTADNWWTEYSAIKDDIKMFTRNITVKSIVSNPRAMSVLGKTSMEVYSTEEYADLRVHDVWDKLEEAKDKRLWFVLQGLWNDAPDSISIHSWPSWGRFCDLCSEGPHCLDLE
ncbi:hypothetical protein STASHLEY_00820 [Brevundimonas phage vB_BpoS-StAshley]|nr:hypothetical protein STASHLEY_00820 [Brevundimonas phage vB_BpoS-StAshley]